LSSGNRNLHLPLTKNNTLRACPFPGKASCRLGFGHKRAKASIKAL
jgi:hypothetical protein